MDITDIKRKKKKGMVSLRKMRRLRKKANITYKMNYNNENCFCVEGPKRIKSFTPHK